MERKNIIEIVMVAGLVVAGTFLRLYRFEATAMFQGDQGRDAIVVKRLIKDFDPVLLGPVTSVGNMYLGPFYYYFMAPWLWLTYPDPIGPAYGVALLGILSLPLFYVIGKRVLDKTAAMIGLVLYVFINPLILYSRFSWNPNLAPIVSLVCGWFLYRVLQGHSRSLLWVAVCLGILTQLHYVAMIMLPVSATVVGITSLGKTRRKELMRNSWLSLALYVFSWTPLVVFDLTHNGLIRAGFASFFTSTEGHLQPLVRILMVMPHVEGRALHLLAQLLGATEYWQARSLVYGSLLFLGITWIMGKRRLTHPGCTLITVTLSWTIGLTAFYSGSLFDHYLLFAVPFIAMYWGLVGQKLWSMHILGKAVVVGLLSLFVVINVPRSAAFTAGGPMITFYQQVASAITPHISDGPYNIALLSENRDYKGMNYRYFFEITEHPPESPDLYYDLNQLVVIDEVGTAEPLTEPIYEIQRPGLSRLVKTLTIPNGLKVYIYE